MEVSPAKGRDPLSGGLRAPDLRHLSLRKAPENSREVSPRSYRRSVSDNLEPCRHLEVPQSHSPDPRLAVDGISSGEALPKGGTVAATELGAFESEYRDMSDTQLVELYRLGPTGFISPEIWQVLVTECHRRHLETEIDAQNASAAEADAEDARIAQLLVRCPEGIEIPVEESLQLLRAHIGPNWNEHYKAAFLHFSEGGAKLHWTHAASLVRGWLWYRRLYPAAVVFIWLYLALPLMAAVGLKYMHPSFAVVENVSSGVVIIVVFGSALWRGGYGDSLVWEKAR